MFRQPQNRRQSCRFTGFTLVELLVVVALTGALVGLLLPAVQSARESARRTACGNHLRQIGLALLSHESQHGTLPTGCIGWRFVPPTSSEPFRPQRFISWNVELLPHLEQQALHDAFRFDLPSYHPDNYAVGQTLIDAFLCPSTVDQTLRNPIGLWQGHAFTDYGGVYGLEGPGCELPPDDPSRQTVADRCLAALVYDEPVALQQITDGTTHTVAVGELLLRRVTEDEWVNGNNLFAQQEATPLNTASGWGNDLGGPHSDGALVVFCDARVEFLSDDISQQVLNAMLTRSGGEEVTDAP